MNTHNSMQQYSHEAIRKQIESGVNIGGPPLASIQPLQATGCDPDVALEVQQALDCSFNEQTLATGPLRSAMTAGEIINQLPFSCMIDLINSTYSNCGEDIPENKRQAAYNAFTDITGYKPADLTKVFGTINNDFYAMINFNSFYMFFPTFFIILIAIWLMVGFNWMAWPVGLFLSVLVAVILYVFSILYRIHAQSYFLGQNNTIENEGINAQRNLENSIAYWPQGLFAVACAVTCTGGTGCWSCNQLTCPPCSSTTNKTVSSVSSDEIIENKENDKTQEEKIKPTRKKRVNRRRF